MKIIPLKEILTANQIKKVHRILKDNTEADKATEALKTYLATQREGLEAKGILPEYLAYAIVYSAHVNTPWVDWDLLAKIAK